MSTISVATITHNSSELIGLCLGSVQWADEIVVVDGMSTDNTVEICNSFPTVNVIVVPNNHNLDVNKNIAIDNCRGDWVLVLDSDEVVTPELAEELRRTAESGGNGKSGYFLPRRNYFLGRWMKSSGWYPDHVLRFFQRAKGRFPCDHVHERLELEGEAGYLSGDLLHYTYRDFGEYFMKMDRYTSFEARYMLRLSEELDSVTFLDFLRNKAQRKPFIRKIWWKYAPLKPFLRFLLIYFARKGFLDGRHGLMLAILSGFSDYVSLEKHRLLKEREGSFSEAADA